MGNTKNSVNQRFIEAVDYIKSSEIGDNKVTIANKLEISPSKFSEILNKRMSVGVDIIADFCELYSINTEWLLMGKGSMLSHTRPFNNTGVNIKGDGNIAQNGIGNKINTRKINTELLPKETQIDIPVDKIPFVNEQAIAGFGNSQFAIEEQDVKEYYVVPKFKHRKIDFMIEVSGSSMYPKYNSGDVVACKIIRESKFIQWNKTHVIATTEQGILIKRLKKGKNDSTICAVSDNPDYEPFEIPTNEITGLAMVVGVIRLE